MVIKSGKLFIVNTGIVEAFVVKATNDKIEIWFSLNCDFKADKGKRMRNVGATARK